MIPDPVAPGELISIILENEKLGKKKLAPRHLAEKYNVKVFSVHRVMARLRNQGLVVRKKLKVRRPKPQFAALTPADVAEIVASDSMDKATRVKTLSQIAALATDSVRISAIKALEDIERGEGSTVGPSPPLTSEEAVSRLARLMFAIGPELTEIARQRALEMFKAEQPEVVDETKSMDRSSVSEVSSGAIQEAPRTP